MRKARARAALALALSIGLVVGMTGCKPTDFFTEVVIDNRATVVDDDNPDKVVVNSPDAETESDMYTSLDWTDDSPVSEEVQNLVVFGSEPNSTLPTHHSWYDLKPKFKGIEASDGVRLVYGATSDLDSEAAVESSADVPDESDMISGDGAGETSDTQAGDGSATAPDSEGEEGQVADESQEEADVGDDWTNTPQEAQATGETPNPQGGSDPSPESDTPQVYDPNNSLAEVPQADRVAVLGGADLATLVQSLAGEGAICAMTSEAWYGEDSSGMRKTYASFGEVFAGEFPDGAPILWDGDGANPDDLANADKLVEACGQGGVILYDQNLGDKDTFFSEAQQAKLGAAGIQLVPVTLDMSQVRAITDTVTLVRDVLRDSVTCALDVTERANVYIDAVNSIAEGVGDTVEGGSSSASLVCYVATAAESGVSWKGDARINTQGVLLFRNEKADDYTPLATWGQAAGVNIRSGSDNVRASSGTSTGNTANKALLWPLSGNDASLPSSSVLSGWQAGSVKKQWLDEEGLGHFDDMRSFNSSNSGYKGLGTSFMPYLVVCADDLDGDGEATGREVESAVEESMEQARRSGKKTTPYTIFTSEVDDYVVGAKTPADANGKLFSNIGIQTDISPWRNPEANPFIYHGLTAEDVVVANPDGLLTSWAEGGMESVLEAVFLADLYSASPDGCDFEPNNDMGKYTATIDGVKVGSLEETLREFYRAFYRLDGNKLEACVQGALGKVR